MATNSTFESNISAIQTALANLNAGKLTQDELESLVENAKEVYERAVVLRYKAFELKVFGEKEVEEPIFAAPIFENSFIEETELEVSELELDIPAEELEEKEEEIVEENPAFDFSLFDDTVEEVKEEELEEDAIEHVSVTATHTDDFGIHEDKIIMEQVTLTPTGDENRAFLDKFTKKDMSSYNQISSAKIVTLIGAFGLNERLQYINELFDGSSEDFSEAIKAIDNFGSLEEALMKASIYAKQHNWDNSSETVEEFVHKIKRRYV
ncbi:MAG: hypothetical protein RI883_116 [Bacteroidota bacterium]|jgi:hypothetical protein